MLWSAVLCLIWAVLVFAGCAPEGAHSNDATPDVVLDAELDSDGATSDGAVADLGLGADAGLTSESCAYEAMPKGARLLGIDLLNTNEANTFDVNIEHAHTLGVEFIALHVPWDVLEATPGEIEDTWQALAPLAGVARANDWRFSITLRPIDLTGKTVPSDLQQTRFNDPEMIVRFNRIIDHVVQVVGPQRLVSIQVGNEIDGYDTSNEHPDFWSDYGAFLFGVVTHTHATHPGVRIGYTGTLAGLTEGPLHDQGVWAALAGVVDVLGVTWYPQHAAFQVDAPASVAADLDRLVAAFPDTPILLQEVGYQSAAACGSTDALQAAFFCEAFAAWDAHRAQIEAINIVRLGDVSLDQAEEMAGPYGLSSAPFIEYLRTLGLRTWAGNGEAKPAFEMVRQEAARRGW
jgi:hypothetical protein